MGVLERYRQLTQQGVAGQQVADNYVEPTTLSMPVVDSSNAIGSLAEILGPTPAEREAQQRRMMEGKAKMQMWTGLFDGLRQLGNLYYATKGATPQQYQDPYGQVDKVHNEYVSLADNMANYRRQYAQSLYGLRRQMEEDRRKNMLADAQSNWYNTRDEMARQKAELDKLKAVKVIKNKDGSLIKYDPVSGTAEPLTDSDPLYTEFVRSQINKNNRMGYGKSGGGGRSNGTYGYRTTKHVDPVTGDVITERVPTTGGKPETRVQERKKPAQNKSNKQKGEKRQSRTRI